MCRTGLKRTKIKSKLSRLWCSLWQSTICTIYAGRVSIHWLPLLMVGIAVQCGFGWFFALWMGYWLQSFVGFIIGAIIVALPEIGVWIWQDIQHGKTVGKPTTVLKTEKEVEEAVKQLTKKKHPGQWN